MTAPSPCQRTADYLAGIVAESFNVIADENEAVETAIAIVRVMLATMAPAERRAAGYLLVDRAIASMGRSS